MKQVVQIGISFVMDGDTYHRCPDPISAMLKNYFKVALRNLRKYRTYAFINIAGLAIGLASCMLIVLYVQDELSYDRFHENADRIYRVGYEWVWGTNATSTARTPHPLAPVLVNEFPEVETAVRFRRSDAVVRHDNARYKETRFYYTDASVFDVFSFPLIEGNPSTALIEPNTLVLTEETAQKYFGQTYPMGQQLTVEGIGTMTVTGILDRVPHNAHFTFDFLVSYQTLQATRGAELEQWDSAVTSTYVLVAEGYTPDALETRFPLLVEKYLGPQATTNRFSLDPLTSLHLYSDRSGELGEGSDARYLYIFFSMALFILLLAGINFMSLTTARATDRAREVGVRKVLGAKRAQLVRQFLGESIVLSVLALGLALMLVELALPAFNALTGKAVVYGPTVLFGGLFLGAGLGVGLLAGSYPAFVLSAFRPVSVMKGQATPGSTGAWLRKGLVIVQFGVSTVLIVGTLVIAEQLDYLHSKDLGFDKEQVIVIPMQEPTVRSQYESIKETLRTHPNIVSAAASYHTPGRGLGRYYAEVEGMEEVLDLPTYIVDYDFIDVLGLEIVEGRAFSESFGTDAETAFMVNETAVRQFGWDEPLGKTVIWDSEKTGTIIGVVKDFHIASLHTPIEPLVMHVDPSYFRRLAVRTQAADIPATLAFLKSTFEQLDPNHPFEYTFLDEDFARHYRAEQTMAILVRYAALLAIAIACLGLLGLATFSAQRRTKEIGIRKVLGATVEDLLFLLSKEFARLVVFGFVVACPLAYFAMNRWLADFAYRIDLSWPIFLLAGLAVLGIALLTVSYQSIRAALADPVESLRYE